MNKIVHSPQQLIAVPDFPNGTVERVYGHRIYINLVTIDGQEPGNVFVFTQGRREVPEDGIVGALRMHLHMLRSYGVIDGILDGELQKLFVTRKAMGAHADTIRSHLAMVDERMAFASRNLLGRRNPNLVAAKKDLDRGFFLTDALGRQNVSAAVFAIHQGEEQIGRRIEEITKIKRHLLGAEDRLFQRIASIQQVFLGLRNAFGGKHGTEIGSIANGLREQSSGTRVKVALESMKRYGARLHHAMVKPYRGLALNLQRDLGDCSKALQVYRKTYNPHDWQGLCQAERRMRQGIALGFLLDRMILVHISPLSFLFEDAGRNRSVVRKAVGAYDRSVIVAPAWLTEGLERQLEQMEKTRAGIAQMSVGALRHPEVRERILAHFDRAFKHVQKHRDWEYVLNELRLAAKCL